MKKIQVEEKFVDETKRKNHIIFIACLIFIIFIIALSFLLIYKSKNKDYTINYDEEKASFLKSLENFILSITFVIFSLLINMNAGLDNHCYTDAYNTIIGLYF